MNSSIKIIGISGREGAGKTTISRYMADAPEYKFIEDYNALKYISSLVDIKEERLNNVICNYLGDDFIFPNKFYRIEKNINTKKYMECSFAEPLKIIASIIFQFSGYNQKELFYIFLADSEDSRKKREIIKSIKYKIGELTGRQCLEILGTDIFRDNFGENIWIDTFIKNTSNKVIIPDVRFKNELDMIEKLNGKILLVYKNESDLIITDDDKKQHISKWGFLTFIFNSKKLFKIHNNGTMEELYHKINSLI